MRSISERPRAWLLVALLLGAAPARAGEVAVWEQLAASGPSARSGHTLAWDGFDVILHGGWDGACSAETWVWNGAAWSGPIAGGPSARYSMAAAHDPGRGVVVFYGGYCDGDGYHNSAYEWDGSWHHPTPGTVPYARKDHAMAFDGPSGLVLLHGGEYGGATLDNSWYWDGSVWTQLAAGPNRLGHAMAYDAARQQTVLHGGHDDATSPQLYDDTWRWTGSAWTRISSAGPGARAEHGMVYDATRGVVVVFGGAGANGVKLGDTWQWDGVAWTQLATSGPPARHHHGMAFDEQRRRVVVYGGRGQDDGLLDDTWVLYTRGGACSTGDTCHTGNCVDGVCCETAACAECSACNTASDPGVCAPVADGTPCGGGQCWGGSCLPYLDGGLPPDGPPQEDAASHDAPAGAEAGSERRGWVGWGCAAAPGARRGAGGAALILLLLLPNLGRWIRWKTNLGRAVQTNLGRGI
jgi:hypothetical protein